MSITTRSIISLASLSLLLAACGEKDDTRNLSRLDAELTTNTSDPALAEALEGPIASDPNLKGQSNRDAVRPSDKPLNGAVPAKLNPKQARAEALKLAGGKLMQTPMATKSVTATKQPLTLGEKAARDEQAEKCGTPQVRYAMDWAGRMPAAFPVYPGAHVTEAAGVDKTGTCGLRAVSFNTAIPANEVMDFYYTMARRAGYDAEHLEENGMDVLGGTHEKSGGAYYVSVKPAQGGGTAVDLIVNGGR
ncbi:MAG: hypothetical protein R3E11_08105 [Sphingobium sp.]|nr:hypothetical protein [Sphingobium sp.]MCP5397898.1 hypothetical protein [Sphingomonas sp.]